MGLGHERTRTRVCVRASVGWSACSWQLARLTTHFYANARSRNLCNGIGRGIHGVCVCVCSHIQVCYSVISGKAIRTHISARKLVHTRADPDICVQNALTHTHTHARRENSCARVCASGFMIMATHLVQIYGSHCRLFNPYPQCVCTHAHAIHILTCALISVGRTHSLYNTLFKCACVCKCIRESTSARYLFDYA